MSWAPVPEGALQRMPGQWVQHELSPHLHLLSLLSPVWVDLSFAAPGLGTLGDVKAVRLQSHLEHDFGLSGHL